MSDIAKHADSVLNQWGDSVRSGNQIRLEAKISSIYTLATSGRGLNLADNIVEEVDHIVGSLQEPIRRVVRRYYLDEIAKKRYAYHSRETRTIKMKARSESLSEHLFKDYLRIGRFIVHQKLQDAKFI